MLPALIGAVGALAQLVPSIVPLFSRDETAPKAAEVVSTVAKVVTGTETDEAALDALNADPKLLLEYQRQMDAQAVALYQAETERLGVVNRTIRAEAKSTDSWVRRMRPTFGYVMALAWLISFGAMAWVIVTDPDKAPPVLTAFSETWWIWTTGLSGLGVYVAGRTAEKGASLLEALQPLGLGRRSRP